MGPPCALAFARTLVVESVRLPCWRSRVRNSTFLPFFLASFWLLHPFSLYIGSVRGGGGAMSAFRGVKKPIIHVTSHCKARALQESRGPCDYSPQRLHVAYLKLQTHTAVVAVARCVAFDWAVSGDHKRRGLCDRRTKANEPDQVLSDVQKKTHQQAGLLNCPKATCCHSSCKTTAHREQQARAAADPNTRSNPASMRQPACLY